MATLVRRAPFRFSDGPARDEHKLAQREPLLGAVDINAFEAMTALDGMRARAAKQFDEEDARHSLALETLWHCAFPGDAFPRPFERHSERWSELGFQGRDPVTDLRGGGYLALEHLVRFVVGSRGLATEDYDPTFPLAIASINCTAMLIKHFSLHQSLVLPFPGASEQPECSTGALHHLLALHHSGTDALQTIHANLLGCLQREWRRLERPGRTIMDFPVALGRAYRRLCDATPPGWGSVAPQEWLHRVGARLQVEHGHGSFGEMYAHDCCAHPGAALALIVLLLRSLAARPPHGVVAS